MSERPSVGLFFDEEAYVVAGDVKGRHAAGAAFLKALALSRPRRVWSYSGTRASAEALLRELNRHGARDTQVVSVPLSRPDGLAEVGFLHRPDPAIGQHTWQRLNRSVPRAFSVTGVTHTTASIGAMEAIAGLLTAPVMEWDALICTSRAVQDSVRTLLDDQRGYLRERFGATRLTVPQLPVIPLGVHCSDFRFDTADRIQARAALDLAPDEVAVIFVGRLSFHAKAHPAPMYLALEQSASGRKIALIQAGWFANQAAEKAFRHDAAELAPSVKCVFVDGRDQAKLRQVWAAADIFTSLSDNYQETFGLAPLEAMAAGLPVVVSDWDGYRDTVRDGQDGFRIPTLSLSPGSGGDLADYYDLGLHDYDHYLGHTSQLVAVDVGAAAAAFTRLIEDPALRRQMGEAGRGRARSDFDWSVIFRQYIALWDELGEQRRAAPQSDGQLMRRRRPDRPDPFTLFGNYPSSAIVDSTEFSLRQGASVHVAVRRKELLTTQFAAVILPSPDLIEHLLTVLGSTTWCSFGALTERLGSQTDPAKLARALVWLAKVGVLDFSCSGRDER